MNNCHQGGEKGNPESVVRGPGVVTGRVLTHSGRYTNNPSMFRFSSLFGHTQFTEAHAEALPSRLASMWLHAPFYPQALLPNAPQACIVKGGSPCNAWGWSQHAATYLPSITSPPWRLPHTLPLSSDREGGAVQLPRASLLDRASAFTWAAPDL